MKITIRNTLSLLLSLLMLSTLPVSVALAIEDKDDDSWNMRYAVSLYGIEHDSYEGGGTDKAGLTFGPATGGSYLSGYKAHVTEEKYRADPEKNCCLHWMTWEEIAAQSLVDPHIFQPCLENGCTHAVDLRLNDTLLHTADPTISGDGAGALLNCLKAGFQSWNGGHPCPGGWPASRMRATLNGADALSNPSLVGQEHMLDADSSLFSCFPEDLQRVIVAKEVVSDLSYDSREAQCTTTFDRLWLFSAFEFYGAILHSKPSEGPQYERNIRIAATEGALPDAFRMYSEEDVVVWAWLRSASPMYDVIDNHIFGGGHMTEYSFYNHFAVTPCFCLA